MKCVDRNLNLKQCRQLVVWGHVHWQFLNALAPRRDSSDSRPTRRLHWQVCQLELAKFPVRAPQRPPPGGACRRPATRACQRQHRFFVTLHIMMIYAASIPIILRRTLYFLPVIQKLSDVTSVSNVLTWLVKMPFFACIIEKNCSCDPN